MNIYLNIDDVLLFGLRKSGSTKVKGMLSNIFSILYSKEIRVKRSHTLFNLF